jgi:hypothetical protein
MKDDMTAADQSESAQHRATRFFLERHCDQIAHPSGTLDDHLHRVSAILRDWGYSLPVQLAGLTHATYGTDGFGVALLGLAERTILREVIGAEAEALVYLYASCDRAAVYPQLGNPSVSFTDRFTGTASIPDAATLRGFVAITAANELDVVAHSHAIADARGADLLALVARARRWLPDSVWWACLRGLAAHVPPAPGSDR